MGMELKRKEEVGRGWSGVEVIVEDIVSSEARRGKRKRKDQGERSGSPPPPPLF